MRLVKGNRYSYRVKRRVRSGKYLGRYYNKVNKQWHFKFELCFGYYHTPTMDEAQIIMMTGGSNE